MKKRFTEEECRSMIKMARETNATQEEIIAAFKVRVITPEHKAKMWLGRQKHACENNNFVFGVRLSGGMIDMIKAGNLPVMEKDKVIYIKMKDQFEPLEMVYNLMIKAYYIKEKEVSQ